jgi:hypothetical protein
MAGSLPVVIASDQSAVPVSGTVTADLSATDNAVLDAIAASVAAIDTDTTTIIGHVDGLEALIGTTNSTLTTIDGRVDGVETLLTAIDGHVDGLETSNSAIQTSVELIDDAIKADDAAFTPATTKVMMAGFEFDDTSPDSVDEGDAGAARMSSRREVYTQLRDAAGNERGANVNASNQLTVIDANSASALTSLQLIDDIVYTDDTSTHSTGSSKGALMMAAATPTDTAVNANDIGAVAMTVNRELLVQVNTALPAGTNAIGKLAANSGVDIGDVDVTSMPGTGVEDAGETAGGTLVMMGAVRRDTAASSSGTTGDNSTVNVDSLGRLWVSGAVVEDAGETAGGILLAMGTVRRDAAASSAGTDGDNATLNTDATGRLWVSGTVIEDVAHSAGESLNSNAVRRIDTPATSAGSSGDWATMDASAEGALWTTNTPTTTGGCSIFRSLDIDETEEDVKTSAGNVYGYYFGNVATSVRYLKFYNATAANTTVGSTTPVLTFPLPASSSGHVAFSFPVGFATAICVAATTGVADADTGAPSANDVIINVFYK